MGKPCIVWVPGWACDGSVFDLLIEGLGRKYTHDIVGWEECLSDWKNGWTTDGVGESNIPGALLKRIAANRGRTILAGASLGAMLTMRTAVGRPWNVAGLILLGYSPHFIHQSNYPGTAANVRAMRRKIVNDAREAVLAQFFREALSPVARPSEVVALAHRALKRFDARTLARGLDYLVSEDLRGVAKEIRIPNLLIHGIEDRIIDVQHPRIAGGLFLDSTFHSLQGHGHMPYLACPDVVIRLIGDFLESSVLG